ncbi:MAG: acyltransferase family protein [Rhizobiales bacterium]|nr:acyltransferase family protein [Hyphomicrobiales bacterium]
MEKSPAIGAGIRPEIQGLRAIAAMAVVVFHIWPHFAPGGYVGVDVFFVISGFLITSLLIRETRQTGKIHLGTFYWRRLWRLLPVALFVIFAVGVLTPLLLPPSQWKQVAIESISSAFYFQNWQLAAMSVDYLAAEDAPSPLQHYWSLSIEEQFYIFWPALIMLTYWVSKKWEQSFIRNLTLVILAFSAVSLLISILLSWDGSSSGYFLTQTRIWELGLGGCLSVLPSQKHRTSETLNMLASLVGLFAIGLAIFLFSGTTPFPGYAALLPTLGTVLVIQAGATQSWTSAYTLLKQKPFQWLGDRSYSIYLWHWPIVIFYRMSVSDEIGIPTGMGLLALTLVLSVLSKRFVEDKFRHPVMTFQWWRRAMPFLIFLPLPFILWGWSFHQVSEQKAYIRAHPEAYPGAMALLPDAATVSAKYLSPPMAMSRFDKAAVYTNGCHLADNENEPVGCHYGNPAGTLKVFLIGDSHAVNWVPAFRILAQKHEWNATSYTKSACGLMPILTTRDDRPYRACFEWGQKMNDLIRREKPDLVIITQSRTKGLAQKPGAAEPVTIEAGLKAEWKIIEATGARIVAIADTPIWPVDPDVCLFRDRHCKIPFDPTWKADPIINAAHEVASVTLIDLDRFFCPDQNCPAVIGNVIVWRDRQHVTQTYSRSLAPILDDRLMPILDSLQPKPLSK